MSGVNPDLQKEREKATFQPLHLTNILYGGAQLVRRRRAIENLALNDKEAEGTPTVFLSRTEAYSEAVRKAIHFLKKQKEHDLGDGPEILYYKEMFAAHENSPIGLHGVMFLPTILGQGTTEQIEKWGTMAKNYEILGTYAQTEMGHGTFLRQLETTATYDPSTEEFILNSPTVTSTKWWPGNLGKTTNCAVVLAQLHARGECHGVHPFILQTRSLEDHKSMPGVTLGDIGPKFGYATNDNGFMRLNNVRIPRDQMLMRYAQVSKDGVYTRKGHSKLTYLTMVFVRAIITFDCARTLAEGCTIAIRYSAIRRQGEPDKCGVEPQVLDYQTQQYKLLPNLATSMALWFAGMFMRDTYLKISSQINEGNIDELPQLHALSAGLKAYSSWLTSSCLEECRMACGGHGYSHASGFIKLYVDITPACTYEGENTVMMLQVARYLMKCYGKAQTGATLPKMVEYLTEKHFNMCTISDGANFNSIVNTYQHRAFRLVQEAAQRMASLMASGKSQEEAWNMTSVALVKAAYAHTEYFVVKTFVEVLDREMSPEIHEVLAQVCELYGLHGIVEQSGSFLVDGFIGREQMQQIERRQMVLLALIRPNAVALVDSFDFHDRALDSVLGRYDGQVYENLYKWAQQSTLNKTDVHESYYKYLRPMFKSKSTSSSKL